MSPTRPDNLPETPSTHRPARCVGGLLKTNLKAHLDGEMSAVRNWLVRWHLAQCAECREELRWLHRLGEDMKDIESARPRPELRARILANLPSTPPAPGIRVVHSRQDLVRSPQRMPRLALAGGLAMLVLFSAAFAVKRSSDATVAQRESSTVDLHNDKSPEIASTAPQANAGVTPMAAYVPEDDPNNALADKMFHERMTEMEREKQMLGQDDWHRLLAKARAVARKTDKTPATEMGIALTVSNIAIIRTHLPTWAKQEGVRLVTSGKTDPDSSDNTPLLRSRTGESLDNLIAFYVPAERGPAFLGALRHLGQISILPLTANPVPSTNLKNETHLQVEADVASQRRAVPAFPMTADSGTPTQRVAVAHDKSSSTARVLVVTVLLQTAAHD
jgi:hypothetical protein